MSLTLGSLCETLNVDAPTYSKTTTMLFKMLGLERAYALRDESVADAAKPRQVFVTQSRVLASRVEEYFAKLLESLTTAKKSKEEIKRIADHNKQQEEESNLLYDVDDDVTWKAGLPEKFSLLEDEHFPLFLTFERVSRCFVHCTILVMIPSY